MFRQLKQTKKATPVRRRIGVLRKYEEGREYWQDTGESSLEDTTGKDDALANSQDGPSKSVDVVATSTEERCDEQTERPEVIVIEDSDDEESLVGGCLSYRSPLTG